MKSKAMKKLYLIVIFTSLMLYLIGVISGLYASKIIKQQTETEISLLKESITGFRSNLENIQIQQNFFSLFSAKESCGFSKVAMDYLYGELSYFWSKLPYRIEESEKESGIDYSSIKREYSFLALKAWIMATQDYNNCGSGKIPVLYFYSGDCSECVLQGEYLDDLKSEMLAQGKEVIAFAIDSGLNESSVDILKRYYNISGTPAIIINNTALHGRAHDAKELKKII